MPLTASSFFVGLMPNQLNINWLTRHDFIEFLQIGAFLIAIFSGVLTMYHIHCKLIDRRKLKRESARIKKIEKMHERIKENKGKYEKL